MSVDRSGMRTGGVALSPTSQRERVEQARTWMGRMLLWANQHAWLLLAGMIAVYVIVFATLACLKLAWFRQGFDMAGNEQTIWNTLHGRPFRISVFAMMDYDLDDGPVLLQFPLALLYGIYESPYTLLVLQTLALGLAAWPLFLLGRDALGVPWQGLALVAIYLLHPTTQHINMYEFQLRSFMIPFALGALLFLKRGHFWPYALMLFLMMCTKTEAGFTLIVFGLLALWLRRSWPFAIFPLVLGPAWVVVALGVIVPRFSRGDFILNIYSYGKLGNSIGEVIWNVATNPMLLWQTIATGPKFTFLGQLFGLQGFLALLSPTTLLGLPVLLMNLITDNRVQWSLNYQYPALVYPFLIVAAAEGLARLGRWFGRPPTTDHRPPTTEDRWTTNNGNPTASTQQPRWPSYQKVTSVGMAILLLIAVVANVRLNNVVQSLFRVRETPERVAAANALLAHVPRDASVAATSFLGPHLAQREAIYFFPGNNSYPRDYIDRATYIAADSRPPGGNKEVIELLREYMQNPAWELVAQEGDFVLLRQR